MVPLKKQSHYCSLDLVFSKPCAIIPNTDRPTLTLSLSTQRSLIYWLVSSIERRRKVIHQRVSGLSENLETFSSVVTLLTLVQLHKR